MWFPTLESRSDHPISNVEDRLYQFSRAHNSSCLPDIREMPPVSCHKIVRARGFGTFQKAIVPFVRRDGESRFGHDQGAVLPDERQRFRNFFGQNWKLGPTQYSFVFEQDWRRDEKPKTATESKFKDMVFQSKRAEVR